MLNSFSFDSWSSLLSCINLLNSLSSQNSLKCSLDVFVWLNPHHFREYKEKKKKVVESFDFREESLIMRAVLLACPDSS